ncbi:hypothetical protein EAO71_33020 [Streptomyces sp. ms191]|uniref:hypothetical protein n=1 Tax=Streptomyces sp. ms191 TaxID=1827978 RepID=UPI0011CE5325|nr:hypothetical protein [Streptomyces sp. ms191]TXS20115.1 hypothetical protein EAO71_33020 [Streptomyces sp. ms191]
MAQDRQTVLRLTVLLLLRRWGMRFSVVSGTSGIDNVRRCYVRARRFDGDEGGERSAQLLDIHPWRDPGRCGSEVAPHSVMFTMGAAGEAVDSSY